MKWHRQHILRSELRAAGATGTEIDELLPLSESLRLLNRDSRSTNRTGMPWHGLRLIAIPSACVLSGIVAGVFILGLAQSTSPNSWLFPVQKVTDNVAIELHPQYREVVMMKRADQVNELVVSHASNQNDMSALADYMSVAEVYKAEPHTSYAAFRYCASKLAQAEKAATPPVSQAIQHSLDSLDMT